MENFQYSVQLSDQDWAEFSATAEECGLLQAGLASGDELLSSDIDQGDSSSPLGLLPLPPGQPASEEEEEDAATGQAVSRSRCELVLALGAAEQTPGTSAPPGTQPSLGSGATSPGSALLGPVSSRDDMHRLLQGPAPSAPGEPPRSPGSPGHSTTPQGPPNSPGGLPRSPGRKKRRAMGTKAGRSSGALDPAPARPGSPLLTARPEEGLAPAEPTGRGPAAGAATLAAGARQEELGADSAGAPGPGSSVPAPVTRPEPGVDLSTPISTTEQGTEQIRMTPRAELHPVSTLAKGAHPDVAMAEPDVAVSTPASKPPPDMALSTPASKPPPDMALSTPASKPPPDTALSTPASKPPPNMALSTPASKPPPDTVVSTPASKPPPDTALSTPASKPPLDTAVSTPASKPPPDTAVSTPASKPPPDMALSTPASKPPPDTALSTPSCKSRLDVDLSTVGPGVQPEAAPSTRVSAAILRAALPCSVSEAELDVGVSTPAPRAHAAPQPGAGVVETEAVSPEGPRAKPRVEPVAGAPGHLSGEQHVGPIQAPRKKKVRFSMAVSSPEEPGSGGASEHPSPATAQPSAPRVAPGGRGGPRAWDTVAVGPRPPQPRILKHLPPPAPSALGTLGPRSSFAVTLPEAYEFFFCDTIEEEKEDAEEVAEASQVLAEVQWPDMCEFFFRDCRAQRPRPRRCCPPAAAPREPAPAPPPGDPVPMSIPEAYEHFFGEDRFKGKLGPATLLQLQASETPRPASLGAGPRAPPTPGPTRGERLGLAVRRAGELPGPLTSFTFSQNDMCLVFVAFATWAVRTSDLHTPDAWKTVLLANIGTISAIRHFRRQVRRGRRSPSPSPSRSPSS